MTDYSQRLVFEYTGADSLRQMIKDVQRLNGQLTRLNQLSGKTGLNAAANAASAATKSLKGATAQAELFRQRLESIGRIATGVFLARGLGYVTQQFNTSVADAIKLQRAISEVDTISNKARFSTAAWTSELVQLSNAFNIPVLDVAEAAYQTLSNQIGQAGSAVQFLESAGRLSIATVSDMSTSVNALSSVINSYNLSTSDAEDISAKFFVAIREGRFRLEEVADSIGTVTILASQLGVEFDEVLASISTLTIQGVKTTEAMTGLRNLFQKIIRPTEAMRDAVRELGFESGSVAVNTLGVIGFLEQLRDLSERGLPGLEEFADLFGRIRAGIAGIGLQQQAENFRKIIADLENSLEDFDEAIKRVENTPAFRVTQEMQEFRNFFIKTVGGTLVTSVDVFNTTLEKLSLGILDVSKALASLTVAATFGAFVFLTSQAVTAATAMATFGKAIQNLGLFFIFLTRQLGIATGAMAAFSFAAKSALGPLLAISTALGALAGVAIFAIVDGFDAISTAAFDLARIDSTNFERFRALLEKKLNLQAKIEFEKLNNEIKIFSQNVGTIQANLNKLLAEETRLRKLSGDLANQQFEQELKTAQIQENQIRQGQLLLQRAIQLRAQLRESVVDGGDDGTQELIDNFNRAIDQISSLEIPLELPGELIGDGADIAAKLSSDLTKLIGEQKKAVDSQIQLTEQGFENLKGAVEASKELVAEGQKWNDQLDKARESVTKLTGDLSTLGSVLKNQLDENLSSINSAIGTIQLLTKAPAGQFGGARLLGDDAQTAKDLSLFLDSIKEAFAQGTPSAEVFSDLKNDALALKDTLATLSPSATALLQDQIGVFNNLLGIINASGSVADNLQTSINQVREAVREIQNLNLISRPLNDFFSIEEGTIDALNNGSATMRQLIEDINATTNNLSQGSLDAANASLGAAQSAVGVTQTARSIAESALAIANQAVAAARYAAAISGGAAFANAGSYIRRYNTGGVGTDTVPAMLSPGEFVMNKRETAKFFPQLVGMNNTGRTQRFDSGGVTVGDVNVSLSGVDSPEIVAREIGNQLRREIRRGVLRLS